MEREDPIEKLERQQAEKKANGGLKAIMIILAVVALALAAALYYVWSSKGKLVNELNEEKIDLTEQIQALQSDYENLSALEYNFRGDGYTWSPQDSLSLLVSQQTGGDLAAINAIYRSERLPRQMMNTPQPLVSQAYAEQFGRIAGRRMEQRFRAAGIPLADFRFRYEDSAQGPGDERYILTAFTSATQLDSALRCFASVLAGLDRDGAAMDEFLEARDHQIADARRDAARHLHNEEYLERCVASYLYGAHLASGEMLSAFIGTRRLDDERELALFNGFGCAARCRRPRPSTWAHPSTTTCPACRPGKAPCSRG